MGKDEARRHRLLRLAVQLRPSGVEGGAPVAGGVDAPPAAAAAAPSGRRPPHPPKPEDREGFGAPGFIDMTGRPPAHQPRPLFPELDPPGADKLGLTPEEIAHFREYGFLVKRNLIPAEELKPFVDLLWEQPPMQQAGVKRNAPSSWVSPGKRWPKENTWGTAANWMGGRSWPTSEDKDRPGATVGEKVMRTPYNLNPAGHMWRWHGIGHDEAFVRATSQHPNMLHMVEALLGGPVRRPRRNRGIYSVFPRDEPSSQGQFGQHLDGIGPSGELKATLYLDHVGPRSGGFTIWPKSPQLFYQTSEQHLNWVATGRSHEVLEQVKASVEPYEFVGGPGDVVFVHGLMLHSVGLQESQRIRLAVILDFFKSRDRAGLVCKAAGKHGGPGAPCSPDGIFRLPTDDPEDDPADGDREVTTQWHIDGNEWCLPVTPPKEDMFAEWNLGRKPVVGDIVDEPAWWEKYSIRATEGPRGGGGMGAVKLSEIASYEGQGVWRMDARGNEWMRK